MTRDDKELLLTDLGARLLYGIILYDEYRKKDYELKSLDANGFIDYDLANSITHIKPYLRPMSSMTEEERMKFTKLFDKWRDDELFDYIEEGVEFSIWKYNGISPVVFDWLNKNHFDYRGLIPMGLALEAPSNMYNIK